MRFWLFEFSGDSADERAHGGSAQTIRLTRGTPGIRVLDRVDRAGNFIQASGPGSAERGRRRVSSSRRMRRLSR